MEGSGLFSFPRHSCFLPCCVMNEGSKGKEPAKCVDRGTKTALMSLHTLSPHDCDLRLSKICLHCVIGSQVAEGLGNRASNQKIAGSIPGCAK